MATAKGHQGLLVTISQERRGVMWPQAKEHQGLLVTISQERHGVHPQLESPGLGGTLVKNPPANEGGARDVGSVSGS